MSPPGRPKGEYRRAQPEGTPVRRAAALALACALAGAEAAEVLQPRPFGHALGDVVVQRIGLDGFAPAELPQATRAGPWFERRGSRSETEGGRRWLVVEWQIVNVPAAAATLQLPAWQLRSADGAPPLQVAAAPVGVAPLVPPGEAAFDLRPDRPPPAIATAPLRRALGESAAAALALAAAWAGWWAWRQWRARSAQPFARALHALRDADDASAWRCLHAAFDRTAGEVLRPATLSRLFERAPHLEAARAEIERFYAQSSARFFGVAGEASVSPRALCRALRRLERAHER
jgi:mxaA protein